MCPPPPLLIYPPGLRLSFSSQDYATITFVIKSGTNMNNWLGMPANAASDSSWEDIAMPLVPAREFYNAFLRAVGTTRLKSE